MQQRISCIFMTFSHPPFLQVSFFSFFLFLHIWPWYADMVYLYVLWPKSCLKKLVLIWFLFFVVLFFLFCLCEHWCLTCCQIAVCFLEGNCYLPDTPYSDFPCSNGTYPLGCVLFFVFLLCCSDVVVLTTVSRALPCDLWGYLTAIWNFCVLYVVFPYLFITCIIWWLKAYE